MRTELIEADATADRIAALHAVEVAALAVDEPDRPLPAPEDTEAAVRIRWKSDDTLRWLVTDGGEPVAAASLVLPLQHNTHTGFADIVVTPARRRQGTGTGLLRTVVGELHRAGRRSFLIEAFRHTPGAAFCDAHGLEEAQHDRASKLRLADADRDRIAGWAAAPHRGYRLVGWTGVCPDDLLPSYAVAKRAMNDAPLGSLDFTALDYGEDYVRDELETSARRGRPMTVVAAVHEPTGEVAGFTELAVSRYAPARADTEDTGVVPAHRGSGLGLWLKAELLRRVLDDMPEVVEIVTRNDLTNDHMWRINDLLGFRTYATVVERQGKVAELAARLDV